MRKITSEAKKAFESGYNYKNTNTEVIAGENGKAMFLFGNRIARNTGAGLYISNAGWPTATTKERLNALEGVSITQKAGIWYLNGIEWNGSWIIVNDK